jgi:hypothetical protein
MLSKRIAHRYQPFTNCQGSATCAPLTIEQRKVVMIETNIGESESTGDAELNLLIASLNAPGDGLPEIEKPKLDEASSEEAAYARDESPPAKTATARPHEVVTTVPTPIKETAFPVNDVLALPEFDDPKRELTTLCREALSHKNYATVRARYCQLSMRMNLQGMLAPGFRPQPRIGASKGDPTYMLVHRDQLVIDYHWLHATRVALSPTELEHALLLDQDVAFDFEAAWRLTGNKQKKSFRATEALCLTRFQQCQTRTLHSPEVSATLDGITGGWRASEGKTNSKLAKAKRAIGQWIERDSRIADQQYSYVCLWQAREMLGAGASKQLIADLHALMLGESALDRTTIRDKLKRLDKGIKLT